MAVALIFIIVIGVICKKRRSQKKSPGNGLLASPANGSVGPAHSGHIEMSAVSAGPAATVRPATVGGGDDSDSEQQFDGPQDASTRAATLTLATSAAFPPTWVIPVSKLDRRKKLGEGSAGSVYQAVLDGGPIALRDCGTVFDQERLQRVQAQFIPIVRLSDIVGRAFL